MCVTVIVIGYGHEQGMTHVLLTDAWEHMENSTALGNKVTYKLGIKVVVCVLALFALEVRSVTIWWQRWDLWLDPVLFAYNTSKHESTGFAPYELVFGKLPRIPLELEFGVTVGNPSTQPEYAQRVRTALQTVRQVARENLAKVRSARCLRRGNETWEPYEVGQTVWVKRPKKGKFGRKWIGPYKVANRMGVTYRVQEKDGKSMVVHHDNIKKGYIPLDSGRIVSPGRETGDFEVVSGVPQHPIIPPPPHRPRGVHPQRYELRQNIRPPVRLGYD